jgi:hypothetical protein
VPQQIKSLQTKMDFFESDIRDIKQSSTILGLQSTLTSLKNQIKDLKEFEKEFRNLEFFPKTAKEINDLQTAQGTLSQQVLALQSDRSVHRMVNALDDRLDEITKAIKVIRNDKFKHTINKIPGIESNVAELWKIVNYITGQGNDGEGEGNGAEEPVAEPTGDPAANAASQGPAEVTAPAENLLDADLEKEQQQPPTMDSKYHSEEERQKADEIGNKKYSLDADVDLFAQAQTEQDRESKTKIAKKYDDEYDELDISQPKKKKKKRAPNAISVGERSQKDLLIDGQENMENDSGTQYDNDGIIKQMLSPKNNVKQVQIVPDGDA